MNQDTSIVDLVQALGNKEIDVRNLAKKELATRGADAIPLLIEAISSPDKRQAIEAANVLSTYDDPRRIPPLVQSLTSDNVLLAQIAAGALESVTPPLYQEFLDALPNSHNLVAPLIIRALGAMGDSRALHPLIEALYDAPNPTYRYTIIEALGNLGTPDTIDVIEPFLQDENGHVRDYAANAISRLRKAIAC
jgi:HEAT repeat protein